MGLKDFFVGIIPDWKWTRRDRERSGVWWPSSKRAPRHNSASMSDDSFCEELPAPARPITDSIIRKARLSSPERPRAVPMKRPSDFDCNSEKSSYQPHVKSDEEIALDICNTFWRPGLTFSTYKHGSRLICFELLWPSEESLRTLLNEAYQATSLRRSVLDITKLAIRCAPVSLIQELLNSRIVALDQVFENGSTMLHLACIARNADVVQFLCNAGVNYRAQDKYGRTAEQVCFDARIRRLLPLSMHRTSSNPNARASTPCPRKVAQHHDKENIFILARQPRQYDELQIKLQTLEFDVNEEKNHEGDFLIHAVIRGGLCQLPQLLSIVRDQGADVDLCNDEGMTALMIATMEGNTVLVDVLMCVLGSNPNKPNPVNGYCALHYSAVNNKADVANCLIKRGADYNLEDLSCQRPDDLAKLCGSYECEEIITSERLRRVQYLANTVMNGVLNAHDLRVTDLYQLTEHGETLIMLAAKYNRVNNLRILIGREGCPVDAQHGKTGRTALTMACINGHASSVQILMRHDANVSLKDIDGLLPIHHTVINDETDVAEILLQYQRSLIGLHVAYKNARSQKMRGLLKLALQRRESELLTPALFEMSLTGDAQALYCLLEDGDNVNPMSGVGNWPMYLASENGHLDVIRLLHHFRGDMTKKHPSSRNTVLHVACEGGHVAIVKFLLKFTSRRPAKDQLDINGLNNEKKTPLHLASEKGKRKTVSLLLEAGASTAVLDTCGELIHCSQYLGVQFLIENKREEHLTNILQALKNKKDIEKLHEVFEDKFDHNLRDSSGDSPLMVACRYGNFLAVKYLLMSAVEREELVENVLEDDDADSGISAAGQRRRTTSLREDYEEGPEWMFTSAGHQDTRANNNRGLKASSALAQSRLSVLMNNDEFESRIRPKIYSRSTLNLGSDEDVHRGSVLALCMGESHVSDTNPLDGRAAIHRAIEHGDDVNLVIALIDADRNCVNIQDNQGISPIHLACKLSRKKVVQKMAPLAFVDLNMRTLDGKLPEEMTNSKRLIHLIRSSRRGENRRSSTNLTGSGVGFNDSASQTGKMSTLLDFDALDKQFIKIRAVVSNRDEN